MDAAQELASQGIEVDVIDLRTIVPPDMDTVFASVERTGRLIVAAEDRSFAGFVRTIQGKVVERFPGLPTKACGQKDIPGIAQCLALEEATILTKEDIVSASEELMSRQQVSGRQGWGYIPPRFFLS